MNIIYRIKLLRWLFTPLIKFQERRRFKKRLEELRKRDPFIYK
jgi:hypothetical protein